MQTESQHDPAEGDTGEGMLVRRSNRTAGNAREAATLTIRARTAGGTAPATTIPHMQVAVSAVAHSHSTTRPMKIETTMGERFAAARCRA